MLSVYRSRLLSPGGVYGVIQPVIFALTGFIMMSQTVSVTGFVGMLRLPGLFRITGENSYKRIVLPAVTVRF